MIFVLKYICTTQGTACSGDIKLDQLSDTSSVFLANQSPLGTGGNQHAWGISI